jgi:hypothetical protein
MPTLKRHKHRNLEELLRAMSTWFGGFISSLVIFFLFVKITNGLTYPSVMFYVAVCISVLSAPAVFFKLLTLPYLKIKNKRVLLIAGLSLYFILFAAVVTLFITGLNSLGNMRTRII